MNISEFQADVRSLADVVHPYADVMVHCGERRFRVTAVGRAKGGDHFYVEVVQVESVSDVSARDEEVESAVDVERKEDKGGDEKALRSRKGGGSVSAKPKKRKS